MKKNDQLSSIAPYFIVDDVSDTIGFYCQKLGFEVLWKGERPLFAIVRRGGVRLMFRQLKEKGLSTPNRTNHLKAGWHTDAAYAWDAYIWVEDADLLHKQFVNKGVSIVREIENTEYGLRDFEVEDNNGYILCFGQDLDN